MKRRALIRNGALVGAAAFAGCSSVYGSNSSRPADATRRVSVDRVDEPPSDAPIGLEISVEEPWMTESSTALLEAQITNASSIPRTLGPPFTGTSSSTDSEPGILVYSVAESDSPPRDYNPPCFGEGGPNQYVETQDGEVLWDVGYRLGEELEPGESYAEELLIVDDPTHGECFPVGRYRFSEVQQYDRSVESNDAQGSFRWSWTLEIEAVEA